MIEPLEDFLARRETRPGNKIVRCACRYRDCPGWAEVPKWEPWGNRPWESDVEFIGPLETDL